MIDEKDQEPITTENQEPVSASTANTNNSSIHTGSNTKEAHDNVLYDNMIFPS